MRALVVAAALAVSLSPFAAGARAAPEAADEAEDMVSRLFQEGSVLYETAQYEGAIEKFSRAYGVASGLEDEELRDTAVTRLVFNLARAHIKQWEIDLDVIHLRQAVQLLEKHGQLVSDPGDRADGEALLEEARAELDKIDKPRAAAPAPVPMCKDKLDCGKNHLCQDGTCRWDPAYIALLEKQEKKFYKAGLPILVVGAPALATSFALMLVAAVTDATGTKRDGMLTAAAVCAAVGIPATVVGGALVGSSRSKRRRLQQIRSGLVQLGPTGLVMRF